MFSTALASLALSLSLYVIISPSTVSTNIEPSVIPLRSTTTSSAFISGTSIINLPINSSPFSSNSGILLGSIVIPFSESLKRSFTSPDIVPIFLSSMTVTLSELTIAFVS